ncbi:MAG: peptide/nickel transport system permease protein [Frankiales bacterium]|jgi:peptide/nickel transport system permease protein|nr:peptide/nickel transport system permease protein [Frankiales bacterium]MDX6209253.1 peptide/nickel transport system permease protein [Frankiales bacterium]MDX6222216.1 peptide/nickel transport system permease protein [Frankiales bacterium]
MAVAEAYTPTLPTRRGKAKPVRVRSRLDLATAGLIGLVTVIALAAPILAPHNPLSPVGVPELKPGQGGFLLGSDTVGRDILSRILYGLRSSWLAALAVVALGLLIGGLIGLVAGAAGGWIDNVLMRITDAFLALPAPIVAIAVVAGLGPGLIHTLIAVSIVWWPFYARIVRGEIRTLAARPHVEAARLAGAGRVRVALKHLLPGAIPSAAVTASLDIGNLVLTLAGLSFLGLGASAPAPELGADTARNLSYLLQDWWIPVMPGIAVALLALAANVAGDGVRNLMAHR